MERNPEFYPYSTAQTGFNELRKYVITGDLQALRACLALDPSQYHVDFPDYRGNSSLHVAVDMQNLECVRLLLKHKASVRKLGMDDETPLHLAAKRFGPSSEAILTALIEADPGAVHFCDSRCAEKARIALSSVDPSSSSSSSSSSKNTVNTPLHAAVKSCNATAVRVLLAAGSSVYARFVSRIDQKDEAGAGGGGSDEEEEEEEEEDGIGDEQAQRDTASTASSSRKIAAGLAATPGPGSAAIPPSASASASASRTTSTTLLLRSPEDVRRFSSSFRVTTVLKLATKYAHVSASDEAASILSLVHEHVAAAAVTGTGPGDAASTLKRVVASRSSHISGEDDTGFDTVFSSSTADVSNTAKSMTAAAGEKEEEEEEGEEGEMDVGTRAYRDMMRHMWDGDRDAQRQAEYEAALLIYPRGAADDK